MDPARASSLRLGVELETAGGRVAGAVEDEHGMRHALTGRLGLLALLEEAASRARTPEGPA
jgi:hypothetical protein